MNKSKQHCRRKWIYVPYVCILISVIIINLWLESKERTEELTAELTAKMTAGAQDEVVVHNRKLLFDDLGCPLFPIATFPTLGQLGNRMSSYANFIALQWQFGYQLYLTQKFKENLQTVFENVTFPTLESIEHCRIDGWYSVAPLWSGNVKYKKRHEMNILIDNIIDCEEKKMDSCLPADSGKILNIYIKHSHNVSVLYLFVFTSHYNHMMQPLG